MMQHIVSARISVAAAAAAIWEELQEVSSAPGSSIDCRGGQSASLYNMAAAYGFVRLLLSFHREPYRARVLKRSRLVSERSFSILFPPPLLELRAAKLAGSSFAITPPGRHFMFHTTQLDSAKLNSAQLNPIRLD
jgi:hypothetical protein